MEAVVGASSVASERETVRTQWLAARVTPAWRTAAFVALASVLLFLVAWLPRIVVLDAYLTTDEGNWMGRTGLFVKGSLTGDPLLTRQSGHPGVTTMWTALVGIGVENALFLADYVRPDGLEKAPGYLDLLRQARRPFAALTALAVVVIGLLTWRLFGAGPGLLVGVLLAVEPFFMAHSGVVHLDGMLASYITIAYLSALVYWGRDAGRGYLVLCGVTTGLAFLTKTPSSLLAIFVPLLAVASSRLGGRLRSRGDWSRLLADGLLWGVLAGALAFVLWPSLRADPLGTFQYMVEYTETVGGGEHENFFRGQPVADPGPLYYVVAFGLRVAPATMLGVGLLVLGLLPFGPRRIPWRSYAPLGGVVLFIVLFTAMMMIPPKKFDRYLLPTFPSWEILAAVGYWLAIWRFAPRWRAGLLPVVLLVVGLAQVWLLYQAFPYYLSYYNPLFGGGKAASKNIVVGWGEGLDQVTAYLNTKPDADRLTLAGFYPRVLMAQFRGNVLPDKQYDPAEADYIVMYVNAVQRDLANTLRTAVRGRKAEQIVSINGVEYARLYRVPPPPGRSPAGTEFGAVRLDRVFLRSEERRYLKSDDIRAGDTIILSLRWTLLQAVQSDFLARVAVVDERGRTIAETTDPIGGQEEPTTVLRVGTSVTEQHRLPLPLDAEGEHLLVVSVQPNPAAEAIPVTAWPEKLGLDMRRPTGVVVDTVQVHPPESNGDGP